MEKNKIEKVLNLDCREEANDQALQKALHQVKPLAKFEGRVQQIKIEKLLGKICRRYYVDFKIVPLYMPDNVDMYHSVVTSGTMKLADVYGCKVYEVLAKTVVWLFDAVEGAEEEKRMKLRVFTDGSCSGNPGPGGWAAMFNYPDRMEVVSGHELSTTNNRMELMAVAQALLNVVENGDHMNYEAVEIHSDSAYVVNAITKGWLEQWKNNGWRTKGTTATYSTKWLTKGRAKRRLKQKGSWWGNDSLRKSI